MDSVGLPSGNLRLATMGDIPRLCIVAAAGFFFSPTFVWERRYHHQYPEDTPKSYAHRFADIIRDPAGIFVVAEDSYQPDENTKTGAIILPTSSTREPQPGESVIVGFVAWSLPHGVKQYGNFIDRDDLFSANRPEFDKGLERDRDISHTLKMKGALQDAGEK
jgi:hypothetical protein